MIIECINCNKKFNVNSELIPDAGRTIECGSCNHIWFFDKNKRDQSVDTDSEIQEEIIISPNEDISEEIDTYVKEIELATPKKLKKSKLTFSKFLSYILVLLISFFALIIFLDTFKSSLYNIFPNLELILFNLYETFKDIELFIKDLI
jgi:predicted Zn finger-like uncharacterized protein